jgi:hypothetical protein
MCYIPYMCVCVGASDSKNASDDINFLRTLCRVHRAPPRGVPGGARYAPPNYVQCSALGQHPEICF